MFSSNASQVSTAANYVEDVFSTYLYTGTASAQTITNGIDLSGKGGMVWLKSRSGADSHYIVDTARGSNKVIYSNLTIAEETLTRFSSFNSNGFSLSTTPSNPNVNGYTYASWTFRKQAKFFDVVTYTGTGAASRNISHSLNSVPGCIICKATSISDSWGVYHRSTGANGLYLNGTNSAGVTLVPTNHTSTTFEVANGYGLNNVNGVTYVAYLFAHDAGGFGASGSDNVISCGSVVLDGAGNGNVTLGYEPQWVLAKQSSATSSWELTDTMRGMPVNGNTSFLQAQSSSAEDVTSSSTFPTSTGFKVSGASFSAGATVIYIAIRRGPMKTPTSGTSVFAPVIGNSSSSFPYMGWNSSFTTDGIIYQLKAGSTGYLESRLMGNGTFLQTTSTAAETTGGASQFDRQTGVGLTSNLNLSGYIGWLFRRAPGFFDVVCYTGTGVARTVNHNLGVAPELLIVKPRNLAGENWIVYNSSLNTPEQNRLVLNGTFGQLTTPNATWWNSTNPTSSVFSLGTPVGVNGSSYTYVAYLFATCPGVSKVGSYTGTAALQTINCGFSAGAKFVLIKRTDSTGDWYVWDSARGISSGNDPYLLLNSTAAEVTGTNYVDTTSVGFQVTAAAPAGINASGGSYIFLAVS